jgi:hypothetical protein
LKRKLLYTPTPPGGLGFDFHHVIPWQNDWL